MDNMDEVELFTVDVVQAHDKRAAPQELSDESHNATNETISKIIGEFQNMVSARVIKGRMLELEHSNLAGPAIKFKTVINYEKSLDQNALIGISFRSQDGYIRKDEDEE